MRSYMLDADGSREFEPVSRISVHESTKGDGTFDKHAVFIDKLVLPRFILPLDKGSVLTMETNADDIYKYTDTTATGWRRRRNCFSPAQAARGTSSTSRAASSGRWTTGSTAPTTRSGSDGRLPAS